MQQPPIATATAPGPSVKKKPRRRRGSGKKKELTVVSEANNGLPLPVAPNELPPEPPHPLESTIDDADIRF